MRYKPSKKSGNKKRGQETSLSRYTVRQFPFRNFSSSIYSLFDFSLPKDNDIELAEKEVII